MHDDGWFMVKGMRSLLVPAAWIVVAAVARPAVAEPVAVAERFPDVPRDHAPSIGMHITDRLTWLGNTLGEHLDLLSGDMVQLRFDGRRRRAHVRLGGGTVDALQIQFDGDVQFDDANARVRACIDLALHGHLLHLDLPDFEVRPTEYHGDHGVQVQLPVFILNF
jgi:hypothetical protein